MFYKLIAEKIESKRWIFHRILEAYYDERVEGIYFRNMLKLANDFETKIMTEEIEETWRREEIDEAYNKYIGKLQETFNDFINKSNEKYNNLKNRLDKLEKIVSTF
ncbi:hypothetical protein NO1_1738 [Candidatus Termititenax aidoneus]|uniref:Uncharacterized protein n=1 Tax=Termititenax aidoneus TaxID=2218524 RepID=A0A388TCI7_TERA1|nr:hypothetical protein NO1_1738 [Candidatus Termititenax aidoneus]